MMILFVVLSFVMVFILIWQQIQHKKLVREIDYIKLSYEVLHELIEVINFYDPEHIEIVWKYRDEFLEAIG